MRKLRIEGLGLDREFENELQHLQNKLSIWELTKEEKEYIYELIKEEQEMNLGFDNDEELQEYLEDIGSDIGSKTLHQHSDIYAYITTMGFDNDRLYIVYEEMEGK